jgi:hypothetical protein
MHALMRPRPRLPTPTHAWTHACSSTPTRTPHDRPTLCTKHERRFPPYPRPPTANPARRRCTCVESLAKCPYILGRSLGSCAHACTRHTQAGGVATQARLMRRAAEFQLHRLRRSCEALVGGTFALLESALSERTPHARTTTCSTGLPHRMDVAAICREARPRSQLSGPPVASTAEAVGEDPRSNVRATDLRRIPAAHARGARCSRSGRSCPPLSAARDCCGCAVRCPSLRCPTVEESTAAACYRKAPRTRPRHRSDSTVMVCHAMARRINLERNATRVLSVARTPCWPRVSLLGASPLRQRSLSRSSLGRTLFRLQDPRWRWKVGCA